MKLLFTILTMGLFSCGNTTQNEKTESIYQKNPENKTLILPKIGRKIQGDFNGDGKIEFATTIKVKEGEGNPVEDGTPDEYEIQFSDKSIKSINVGCCNMKLINEGDLDNNGTDDFSIFQAPMNGCTYSMTTYSLLNGNWIQIVDTFLIPTACENISDFDLQKRIFKENNAIYYYDSDINAENGELIKKKVKTK